MSPATKAVPASTASHDADVTSELRAFMAQSWAPEIETTPAAAPVAAYAAKRRKALSAAFPGEV